MESSVKTSGLPHRRTRRRVAAGVILGVALLAWIASMGAGRIAAGYLALPSDVELASMQGASSTMNTGSRESSTRNRQKGKRGYIDPILKRNIFDSTKVGSVAAAEAPGDSIPKTDLKVVLLATVVAEPEIYSSALISEDRGKEAAIGYGIGDTLLGEAEIVRIEQRRVIIRRMDGTYQSIDMEGNSSLKGSKEQSKEEEDSGVTKLSDSKFLVEQDLVDKLLSNPEQLYSQIRVVPHKGSDGSVDGYRLSGIRRKSLFRQLGMKNGDVVHGVNGKALTSMSGAMEAYNSLQSEKDFSFEITRRNQRQTFEYEIR